MQVDDPGTQQGGTEAAGFRITHVAGDRALRLEAWGFWDGSVAAAVARQTTAALEELASPVEFLMVATDLKPQGDDGQRALRAIMEALAPLTLSKATVYAGNPLVRMQMVRLARDLSLDSRLDFAKDAPG